MCVKTTVARPTFLRNSRVTEVVQAVLVEAEIVGERDLDVPDRLAELRRQRADRPLDVLLEPQ